MATARAVPTPSKVRLAAHPVVRVKHMPRWSVLTHGLQGGAKRVEGTLTDDVSKRGVSGFPAPLVVADHLHHLQVPAGEG